MFKRIALLSCLCLSALGGCTSSSSSDGSNVPAEPESAADPLTCGNGRCEPEDPTPTVTPVTPDASDAPPPAASSCAAALCPVNTVCDDLGGTVRCTPLPSCEGTRCEAGQHCELQAVQCIRAPCPAQPSCVDDPANDPCAAVRCKAGTHCEVKQVQCIRAPCPPVAECIVN